jgi:hypothetical protein
MATWASRRKFIYGGTVIGVIVIILGAVFFSLFYKAPTCFDGIKNGGELGVDCGGSCVKLCQSAFLPAKISWGGAKFEKVAEGLYNAASYIVNPNTGGAALNVPYKIAFFDSQGILITERQGTVTLPARRNTLAFEPAIDTGKRIPVKATFEFLAPPVWFKSHDTLGDIAIVEKNYEEDENSSSLSVTLQNKGLYPYKNITVAAVLSDISGNAIGFSRTQIDLLPQNGGKEIAPFTWAFGRGGRVVTIEALPSNVPVRD